MIFFSEIESIEVPFAPSDCSIETGFQNWCEAEKKRLASKGFYAYRFNVSADPDFYKVSVDVEGIYTLKFDWHKYEIDLVINRETSPRDIKEIYANVPAQFASIFSDPRDFRYYFSFIDGDYSSEKELYQLGWEVNRRNIVDGFVFHQFDN